MRIRCLNLMLVLAFLAGCTLAPVHRTPEPPVPEAWPQGPAYVEDPGPAGAPAPAALPWRDFVADANLRAVIEAALRDNRDLQLAALNVLRARAVYGIRRAGLFPSVDAGAGFARERVPADLSSSGQARTAARYDVEAGIYAWEIDFFGRLRSLRDAALEEFLATEQALRSTQVLLVSAVAEVYLALAADRENLHLAQTTLEAQESAYTLVRRRQEVGITSALDVQRAQTQVAAAQADVARFTRQVALDENALRLLAGAAAPLPAEALPADLAGVAPFAPVAAGVSSAGLLERPDILGAENRLEAANANIGAARAALFPRITLTTAAGTASAELSGLFADGSGTWLFAPQLSLPLFDPRLWSALQVTEAERDIAVVEYEKAIQTAFREVADALAARGTLDAQLAAQTSLVEATAATFRLADERYRKGLDSYLSVLDAQRALYAAQQGLVALRLAEVVSQVRLYAVLGGGAF